MSDPLIRACEDYVVLVPGAPERLLSERDTRLWLYEWLERMESMPRDLQSQPSLEAAVDHLIDTACELEVKPGFVLQWFAVRLEPPMQ